MESTHRLCSVRKAPFSPFTVKLQLYVPVSLYFEEERKPLFSKKRYFSEDWLETMPRFFKLMNEYSLRNGPYGFYLLNIAY